MQVRWLERGVQRREQRREPGLVNIPSGVLTVIASSAAFPGTQPDYGVLDVITDAGITPVAVW